MNRIDQLFQNKGKDILSIYFPAGYPNLNDTVPNLQLLQDKGVDLVEIGIPFSDPLADGPVIQIAAKQSLDQGMSLKLLFEQLKDVRRSITMPLILMGYWNVVFKYGVDAFLLDCQNCGIDGVILPDLPLEEYEEEFKAKFEAHGVYNILLVTPQTTDQRMAKIEKAAKGFLYMVSSSATTGGALEQSTEREDYFKKVASLDIPSLIGFGIHDKASFQHASGFSNGAIIGTAFIKALAGGTASEFVDSLL
ncbi:tryptophan synthase subunit alpha [Labilibaculum euxinus]|uniref:Tryptophan synthase alpha chain n=1 Tax=Labilibaculum euxinus TaxID=2686357 RepID=A0A7M4D8H0_9BACT|nr:tryptophan synthase subunit alpha [Labilibaculum euxinus]MUP38949.1 tryptophan synthase subunit alpha [Labilibaculum euxinus]MVB08154.1 tryptophan synthase subunit alpha [Labilibaculum euxinus]